jgi:NAD(P)-dependent dehydrogenase (short-subunit alcohol dehydrogenase family)
MSETIVVTGATRGLGRAMAEGFAARGHTVVGCGRSAQSIEGLCDAFSRPHRFDVVDVTDDTAVAAWARSVLDSHGPPDRLMNNAAIMTATRPLWEVPAEEMSRILDVNVAGTVNVIRHFVPAMIERGSGVIVNFSSGWGRSVSPDVAPYCATKWAIEGLTRALALELPEGLAAVPFNPGIIDTDMLRVGFGDDAGSYPGPEEWAETAVPFLLALGPRDNGRPVSSP